MQFEFGNKEACMQGHWPKMSASPLSRLPGSRHKGSTSSNAVQLWPNPIPLECGVIRLLEKLPAKLGHTSSSGQKFSSNVSPGGIID